jgi:hypothetical protein
VVYRCESDLHFNLLVEIFEHCTVKVFCVINCDLSGNTVSTNNVPLEEPFDGGGAYICDTLCLNPLCEVFDCHDGEGVIVLCWVNLSIMSMPHHCRGQTRAINCEGYAGAFDR